MRGKSGEDGRCNGDDGSFVHTDSISYLPIRRNAFGVSPYPSCEGFCFSGQNGTMWANLSEKSKGRENCLWQTDLKYMAGSARGLF
jgi:hypothetical protein